MIILNNKDFGDTMELILKKALLLLSQDKVSIDDVKAAKAYVHCAMEMCELMWISKEAE